MLPVKIKGKVAKAFLARGMNLQHCQSPYFDHLIGLELPLSGYALGDIDAYHSYEDGDYRRYS
jgi:hypothetical protein